MSPNTPLDKKANVMRVVPSDLEQLQALSTRLGVSVVELVGVIQAVGTWIPAIERKLSFRIDQR